MPLYLGVTGEALNNMEMRGVASLNTDSEVFLEPLYQLGKSSNAPTTADL